MTTLKIDFVSDIACPWCAVGLGSLEQALVRLDGEVQADLHFQPFELNPHMPPGGQDLGEHLTQKYGSTAEQQAQIRQTIADRGPRWVLNSTPAGGVGFTTLLMPTVCCTGPKARALGRNML